LPEKGLRKKALAPASFTSVSIPLLDPPDITTAGTLIFVARILLSSSMPFIKMLWNTPQLCCGDENSLAEGEKVL